MADRIRSAAIKRDTNETKILLSINLDGGALEPVGDEANGDDAKGHAAQASKSQHIDIDSGFVFFDRVIACCSYIAINHGS